MFHAISDFPALKPLQDNWEIIRDELMAVNESYFVKWPEPDIYDGGWTVFPLYKFGQRIERGCNFCPNSAKILETIPGLFNAGFSSLAAGTHIKPHTGLSNKLLRCHLGLVTPEDCAIRIGAETRAWQPGSIFVFSEETEHEAWNRSQLTRIVLLLDFKYDLNAEIDYPPDLKAVFDNL
jgi:aspartyl/asparaginyl beta-hydroxylase (cupin superfamily)